MVLPALLCLLYIKTYSVNVAIWDQLDCVPLFDKVHTGDLSFADLFAQHNEHRVLFPRLAMLLLGVTTQYNVVAEMYLYWFLLCFVSYLLLIVCIRSSGSIRSSLIKFVPVIWLVFSVRQYENLLFGWQIQWPMVVLFFLLALYLLEMSRSLRGRFALSIVSGIVCSFSMANGLLIWPIGLIQIFWTRRSQMKELKRPYLIMGCVWGLAGIVVCTTYFIDYTAVTQWSVSIASLSYFLAFVGNPLRFGMTVAIGVGVLLLFLYLYMGVYAVKRRPGHQSFMALSLILFALSSAVLLALGRSGLGVEHVLASKYTAFTTLGVVGLYLLVVSFEAAHKKVKRVLFSVLLLLIVLGVALSYGPAMEYGKQVRVARNVAAYYLSTFELQSDENLFYLYIWNPPSVKERARILEMYKLNVFSRPGLEAGEMAPVDGTTLFSIDIVNGHVPGQEGSSIIVNAQSEKTITISGWALDQGVQEVAGGVFVDVDGQLDIPSLYGLDRQDVAEHFENNRYRLSGFMASFATSVLGEGQHTLSLKIITADKEGYYQPHEEIVLEVR